VSEVREVRVQNKLITGGVERDMLDGRGGCNREADHSSQFFMSNEKGSMGVGLSEGSAPMDCIFSEGV
jgi:hypothetical protein